MVALIGADLPSPLAAWPQEASGGQWPDHDGDKGPGIAARMLGPAEGPYDYPPLDLLASRRMRELRRLREISFRDLPLYSYDYDDDFPPVARAFKAAIVASDAVLFVTPEYNRSIPGGLKNAIDWASRPYGTNAFARKPSAVIGASVGAIGTAVAQQHLRSLLSYCNSPQMNAPEAYIQFTPGLITDEGEVTVASTQEFLRSYMSEFHTFVGRVLSVLPRQT